MSVEPYDEAEISSEDLLIRRISPIHHVIWDGNRQRNRVSSKAYSKYSDPKDGMSVDFEALIIAAGEIPQEYVTTPVYTGSVAFSAGDVRALDFIVGYEPIEDVSNAPDNPYHGEVWTKTPTKKFSKRQKDGLANLARGYVELPDVDII